MCSEAVNWKKKIENYRKLWSQLSSSIKGSAIDPISLDCSLSVNEVFEKAISCIEGTSIKKCFKSQLSGYPFCLGIFTYKAQEYSTLEDDADADDDPVLDPNVTLSN